MLNTGHHVELRHRRGWHLERRQDREARRAIGQEKWDGRGGAPRLKDTPNRPVHNTKGPGTNQAPTNTRLGALEITRAIRRHRRTQSTGTRRRGVAGGADLREVRMVRVAPKKALTYAVKPRGARSWGDPRESDCHGAKPAFGTTTPDWRLQ